MLRTPIALVPYLLAAALTLSGYLWHMADQLPRIGAVQSTGTVEIGGAFTLTDQNGTRRTDRDFRGRYMLVFFGYTYCPDVCPTLLGVMQDALGRLGPKAKEITPIFVTVDPDRDTPAVLKSYLVAFGPQFVGLTGTMADVKAAAARYRVYFVKHPLKGGNYGIDHSSTIYLMGPNGRFVTYYNEDVGPDAMAADLRRRL